MAIVNSITIVTEWFKDEPDLTPCDICTEIMVTHTNGLYMFYGERLLDDKPVIKICDSCCKCLDNA